MIEELSIIAITYFVNILTRDRQFVSHIIYVILAFTVLKFFPERTRTLLQASLAWVTFELADAFLNLTNYDDEDYKCKYTASTSKSGKTEEKLPESSSLERDLMSSSSQLQMEESTLPEDSTSAPLSTGVQ